MSLNIIAGLVGGQEILLILVLALLFFGGTKIPELMRGLGKGVKEFKDASKNDRETEEKKNEETK